MRRVGHYHSASLKPDAKVVEVMHHLNRLADYVGEEAVVMMQVISVAGKCSWVWKPNVG